MNLEIIMNNATYSHYVKGDSYLFIRQGYVPHSATNLAPEAPKFGKILTCCNATNLMTSFVEKHIYDSWREAKPDIDVNVLLENMPPSDRFYIHHHNDMLAMDFDAHVKLVASATPETEFLFIEHNLEFAQKHSLHVDVRRVMPIWVNNNPTKATLEAICNILAMSAQYCEHNLLYVLPNLEADSRLKLKFGTKADMEQLSKQTGILLETIKQVSNSMGIAILRAKDARVFEELASVYSAALN